MSHEAKILADSVSPQGKRIITASITHPRFILAEINTHCRLSRNSASSRAIPTEKQIAMVRDNPYTPMFNKRAKGMRQGAYLEGVEQEEAVGLWLRARAFAVEIAEQMLHVDKARVNRLLEPFAWHTCIITGTEWENFNALRIPPGEEVDLEFPAQPEFQRIGLLLRQAVRASTPQSLAEHEWHLPLVTEAELAQLRHQVLTEPAGGSPDDWHRFVEARKETWLHWAMVSAGRCARVSYLTHEKEESPTQSHQRALTLKTSGHMSPFQHQATPDPEAQWPENNRHLYGNYEAWIQFRKTIENEFNAIGIAEDREPFDPRYPAGWLEGSHERYVKDAVYG